MEGSLLKLSRNNHFMIRGFDGAHNWGSHNAERYASLSDGCIHDHCRIFNLCININIYIREIAAVGNRVFFQEIRISSEMTFFSYDIITRVMGYTRRDIS